VQPQQQTLVSVTCCTRGEIIAVSPAGIPLVWPKVKDRVRSVIELVRERTLEFYEQELLADTHNLWLLMACDVIEGIVITHIGFMQNGRKVMVIDIAEGEFSDYWAGKFLPFIEELADYNACDSVEFYGRPGWRKVAKSHGYDTPIVSYRKELKK
jgi:hypothetical protein